jgi:hypothetical protein
MRLITIDVDIASQLSLTDAGQQHVVLEPGESVEWLFVGLPNDHHPAVRFAVGTNTAESPTGPFARLRQTTNQVFATGRSGTGQTVYHVSVQPNRPAPATEGVVPPLPLSLETDPADPPSTAPVVRVRPKPGTAPLATGEPGELEVSPEYFKVVTGETVVWLFEGFTEPHWYPEVAFVLGPEGSAIWPYGPFTSLGVGGTTVVGSGNNHVAGDYVYEVAIRDAQTGEVLRRWRGDPGLGNDADPVGGGG